MDADRMMIVMNTHIIYLTCSRRAVKSHIIFSSIYVILRVHVKIYSVTMGRYSDEYTYIHTYIHYMHTYIHTYIHT